MQRPLALPTSVVVAAAAGPGDAARADNTARGVHRARRRSAPAFRVLNAVSVAMDEPPCVVGGTFVPPTTYLEFQFHGVNRRSWGGVGRRHSAGNRRNVELWRPEGHS